MMARIIMNTSFLPLSLTQYMIRENGRLFVIFPDILKFSGPELLFLQLGLLRFGRSKGIIGNR
jgi:hypothetical protein